MVGAIVGAGGTAAVALSTFGLSAFVESRREKSRRQHELVADRARAERERRRELLEEGSVLLGGFYNTAHTPHEVEPGKWDIDHARWQRISVDMIEHNSRMLVWFDERRRVMRTYTAAVINVSNIVAATIEPPAETPEERLERSVRFGQSDEAFRRERDRYLEAARAVLAGRPDKSSDQPAVKIV